MIKNMGKTAVSVACSMAMALALVPVVAQTAYAGTLTPGTYFSVGGVKYEALAVNPDTGIQVVYVVSLSDEGAAVQNGILNIPDTVTYEGNTFDVCGISQAAFRNCTTIEDLRIGDLSNGGLVSVSAFEGCTGLKVIHFLGLGGFYYTSQAGSKYFDGVPEGLKVVAHNSASVSDLVEREYSTANLPVGSEVYCEVRFNTGSSESTAFVKVGYSVEDKTSKREGTNTVKATLKASQLSSLTSSDVYNDSSSASPICTGTLPSLPAGKTAWAFTSDGKTYTPADDYISSCGAAYAADDTELSYSTVSLAHSTLRYTSKAVSPSCTVTTASGKVLDKSLISVSYTDADGKAVAADSLISVGDYTLTCAGATSALSGSCSASFSIAETDVTWARKSGADRYEAAHAATADTSALAEAADVDQPTTDFYVLVNSDNYAACALADSLAGMLDCMVLTAGKDSVPSSTKGMLASASRSTVLMLGSDNSLGDAVLDVVDQYANTYARVSKSDDPATMATDVLKFVERCKDGTYSIDIEQEYGGTVLVLPASESSASFSSLTWAYKNKAPVLFASSDGTLDSAALVAAMKYKHAVLVGGTKAQYDALSAQISGIDVTQWAGAADEYDASKAYAAKAAENGNDYAVMAFAAPGDYGLLASVAAAVGNANGSLVLGDDAKGNIPAVVTEHQYEVTVGRIYASKADVAETTLESLERIWSISSADNLLFGSIAVTNKMSADGTAQSPVVVVKDSTGKTLTQGTDYKLSFCDNATGNKIALKNLTDEGDYTVTATGTYYSITDYGGKTTEYGYYKNHISCSFSIGKAEAASKASSTSASKAAKVTGLKLKAGKKKLTASWKKQSGVTYQIAYKVKGSKKWKTKTVKANKITLKKLKKGKKYQVRVRAKKGSAFGAWCAVKTVKVKR